ncbi:YSC84-related protein [Vampirovibrio sp.]|uniref:BPSL1445 family SYLF domain-containing lipoprotein n=1 Tax=Vampirovibrio sp. TaxID=2717857 RepID=UPI00359322A4
MKANLLKIAISLLTLIGLGGPFAMPVAHAASAQVVNQQVQEALTVFKQNVKGANEVLAKARGVLVFPRVYQAGIIVVGGEYGEGALLVNGATQAYYNIASGSYGFQLGGQRKAIILAFMNDEVLNKFRASKGWKIGADASVTLITVGAEGSINTTTLNKPILAFVVDQKGLMYNLSLEGSKITKINK